ncbi:MAG: hypothetical protein AAFX08_10695 [Pseudomonadota bacterium]
MRWVLSAPRAQAVSGALAAAGLAAAATPVFVSLPTDQATDLMFLTPIVGTVAFVALLVGRFARGWLTGVALAVVALPVYIALVIGTIAASMRAAGLS